MKLIAIAMMFLGVFSFIFMFVFSIRGIKDKGNNFVLLKNWAAISHPGKKGKLATGTLISWTQTSATNNFDYFFLFTFEADVEGESKKYEAAAVVKISDVHKLEKGLPVVFKYAGTPPNKIAVVDVIYNAQ